MNGNQEFNPKLFKSQLQTLLAHHGIGKLAQTPEGVVADFLDHCLQAFIRGVQDRALMAAVLASKTEPDAEGQFMSDLLNAPTTLNEPPAAPKPGPTLVKNAAMPLFKLPAVADQATIDALAAEVNAAPSPVQVQFLLDGEIQKEWAMGGNLVIGSQPYRVIGLLPDGTLVLQRQIKRVSAPEGES